MSDKKGAFINFEEDTVEFEFKVKGKIHFKDEVERASALNAVKDTYDAIELLESDARDSLPKDDMSDEQPLDG